MYSGITTRLIGSGEEKPISTKGGSTRHLFLSLCTDILLKCGHGDWYRSYWGPMGPGNTFLRNVVKGPGVYL